MDNFRFGGYGRLILINFWLEGGFNGMVKYWVKLKFIEEKSNFGIFIGYLYGVEIIDLVLIRF